MARLDKYLEKLNGGQGDIPAPQSSLDRQMAELANNPPKELPDTSEASVGDVLSLDEDKAPAWTTPSSGLPDASEASAGDVLSLDENKAPAWTTPSGGGDLCVLTLGTNGNLSIPSAGGITTDTAVYLYDGSDWINDYDAFYVYDGDIADVLTKLPVYQEEQIAGAFSIEYTKGKGGGSTTAQAAPHVEGQPDSQLFVTSAADIAVLVLNNDDEIAIIPSTATIETGLTSVM